MRRLEEAGIISGYAAVVDPDKAGLTITAVVRLRYPNSNYKPFHDLVKAMPEILEAHHVTGHDCFIIKVAARSMRHLEEISGRIGHRCAPAPTSSSRGSHRAAQTALTVGGVRCATRELITRVSLCTTRTQGMSLAGGRLSTPGECREAVRERAVRSAHRQKHSSITS